MVKDDYNLQVVQRGEWSWHISVPELLDPWFDEFQESLADHTVKTSVLRDIFWISVKGRNYFVKYHHPDNLFQRFRSDFMPRAWREFAAAKLLESSRIPVIKVVGWGQHGSQSMLLSEEAENYYNARDYWFEKIRLNADIEKDYLEGLAGFVKIFLRAGLIHPEWHISNLLVSAKRPFKFIVADTYGVEEKEELSSQERFLIQRLPGCLRGEMSDARAIEFIKQSGIIPKNGDAEKMWENILEHEADKVRKIWSKRKQQILSGYAKYIKNTMCFETNWALRRGINGKMMIPEGFIGKPDLLGANYLVKHASRDQSEKFWLDSFHLQFYRIDHVKPLIWIKREDNYDDFLIYEKLEEKEKPSKKSVTEFQRRLKIAGVEVENLAERIIKSRGRILLEDITGMVFR